MDGDHAKADHHRKNREDTGSDPESRHRTVNPELASELNTERCRYEDVNGGTSTTDQCSVRSGGQY